MAKLRFICKNLTGFDCDYIADSSSREELYVQIEKHASEKHGIIIEDEEQRDAIKSMLDLEIKEIE